MPQLSVIMVCFNAEATIARSARSVVDGKTAEVEFIVVDGGSKDRTLEQLRGVAECIDRLVSEPDAGIFDAMNKGVALSTGDFVAFLNADDSYLPGALEALLDAIASVGQSCDVIYGDWIGVRADGLRQLRRANPRLGWKHRLCHQAIAARRGLFAPPFDTGYRLCADFDMLLRWQAEGKRFVYLATPLVEFSEAGASNRQVRRAVRESLAIARRRLGVLRSLPFTTSVSLYLLKRRLLGQLDA